MKYLKSSTQGLAAAAAKVTFVGGFVALETKKFNFKLFLFSSAVFSVTRENKVLFYIDFDILGWVGT